MTGVGWLDATASVAFATLAVVALARLALGWRRIPDRGDAVVDAVMAVGMAAMSVPGGGPVPNAAWVVVFAGAGLRSAFVLGGRLHPRSGRPTGAVAPAWWGRSGGAVHHLGPAWSCSWPSAPATPLTTLVTPRAPK